jgi:hypothetical protein
MKDAELLTRVLREPEKSWMKVLKGRGKPQNLWKNTFRPPFFELENMASSDMRICPFPGE